MDSCFYRNDRVKLEVDPELGIAPVLVFSQATCIILRQIISNKEVAVAKLPADFVVLEEEGVDHIDLTTKRFLGVSIWRKLIHRLGSSIPIVILLGQTHNMPANFKVTFFGGPELQIATIGHHILPGHLVHVPKVDMVRG